MADIPNWNNMKSRKFLLTCGTIIISTLLLATHLIIPDIWKDVVMTVFGIYTAGHVTEKVMLDKNKDGIPDEEQDPEVVEREAARLSEKK